jgi:hypothetical protein
LVSIAFLPVSFALTAVAADLIGARATLLVAGAVGSAATFAALFIPGMRAIEGVAAASIRAARRPGTPAPIPPSVERLLQPSSSSS